MTSRFRVLMGALCVCTVVVVLGFVFYERQAAAQEPHSGYENLVLCSLPGATKAEAQYATGLTTLFSQTFTVRVRNWKYLSGPKLWHGEWWLRDQSGAFSWVPVSTSMTCSFYPYGMDLDWLQ